MADKTTKWILELVDQITAPLKAIESEAKLVTDIGIDLGQSFDKAGKDIEHSVAAVKQSLAGMDDETKASAEQALKSYEDLTEGIKKESTALQDLEKRLSGAANAADPLEKGVIAFQTELAENKLRRYKEQLTEVGFELDDVAKVATATSTDVRKLGEEVDLSEKQVKDFTSSFKDLFEGLQSGNLVQISDGFKGIANNIGTMTRSALAFIATPLGATLAALAVVGLIATDFVRYNEAARETNTIISQMTQLEGEAVSQMRVRAKVMEEVFGQDLKDTLEIAKNNVQAFGISYEEAMDNIGDALVHGASANDEYIDSMREYPRMFANAGFNMEEFQKIVDAGFDLGMYSDKLPDAIKELDLSLKEQTKSSRAALENAFGKKFTDELFQNIKNGSITTKEALQQISTETDRVGVNSQQASQLTADLFRGAGEDAGGYFEILNAVNGVLGDQEVALTSVEIAVKKVFDTTKEYAAAQKAALDSNTYVTFAQEMEIFWLKIKTWYYEAIVWAQDWFNATTRFFVQMIAAALEIPTQLKNVFTNIGEDVGLLILTFVSAGDIIKNALSGNWDAAREGFANFKKDLKDDVANLGRDIVMAPADIAKGVVDAYKKAGFGVDQYRETVSLYAKSKPKEGDIKNINGKKYIFKDGEWVLVPEMAAGGGENGLGKAGTGGSGGSGSGSGKSITMTLNIVQNFAVAKGQDIEAVALETVRLINDKLRDAVLTMG
ncbi:MAG: phage tail tape measure protein [Flavobacteriaceae bacterium]|nr:phage tail tape measure protein [Flavobacteriaceae bacterium]